MPSSDYTPEVADVALFLRTRTRDTNGVELGTFTDATRPTDTEVSGIIADTVVNMEDDIGVDIDSRLWSSAKRVTALRAAMAIEVSYFSEQVASNRSVYPQLKEWYEEDLDKLNVAIVETAEGGEPGSDAGEDTPVWGGGDLPFPDGLSPSGVDLRLGSTWPEAIGAFHSTGENPNEDAMRAVLGNATDLPVDQPAAGTIASYLRKIRDLLSSPLHVIIDSGGGGGGGVGLTDAELRATPVPVAGPVTDAQLRATPIPVSHSGLTDAQLRATRVPVDPGAGPFPVSASALPLPTGAATEATLASLASASGSPGDTAWVSGNGTVIALLKKIATSGAAAGLTDAELRATPVPVDTGVVHVIIDSGGGGGGGTGGLTDTELRASAVAVSVATLPLPSGAATAANQASILAGIGAPSDAAATTTGSLIAQARRIANLLAGTLTIGGTVAVSGTVPVSGPLTDTQLRASAVPISAASLPLPTGAATETSAGLAATALGAPGDSAAVTTGSVIAQLRRVANLLAGTLTVSGAVSVSGSVAVTGPLTDTQLRASAVAISAATLPLPSGASTEATLAAASTALGSTTDAASTTNGSVTAHLRKIRDLLAATLTVGGTVGISGSVAVTGTFWQATQPVSGTVTANAGTGTFAVSAASLPLPTGAAQDATLTGGTQKAINRGGAKGATAAADVTSTASGADHQGLDAVLYDASGNRLGSSGTPLRTDPTGSTTQPISAASLPLPAGAATETTLAAANTAIGTTADAASSTTGTVIAHLRKIRDLLAATLTVSVSGSVAVTGTFWQATQPVSIAATVTVDSELTTADLDTGAGTDTRAVIGLVLAKSGGAVNISATDPMPVSGTFFQVTQPVSASSLPLPTGAATETSLAALLATAGATGDAAATGAGTINAHLRSIAAFLTGTLAVSAASLPLPTGAAADATLTGGTQKAIARGGAKGSTVAADVTSIASGANHNALDVALWDASGNQLGLSASPVRTDPTGTTTQPVSAASLPLPTGAATETSVGLAATALGAPGDAAATTTGSVIAQLRRIANELAGNIAVTGTFWQATQPVSLASQPLPTGASTETTLASILTTAGATTDAAATGAGTLNAHLRSIATALAGTLTVTGGGGGTQFAEDAAHTSGDLGTMALGVRKDTAAALATTDGDYMPMIFDASGRLHVNPSGVTQPVSGTFWQATQPVSAASLPLPTGASTETTLASMNTAMGRTKVTTDAGTKDWQHIVEGFLTAGVPTAVDAAHPIPVVQTGTPGLPTGASTETTLASLLTSIGATADAASSTTGSLNAHLRSIAAALAGTLTVAAHAVTNAGTFAVQDSEKLVDNAAFTDGTTKVLPAGYIFDDVAGTALTENDIAAPRIDSKRATVAILEGLTRGTRAEVKAASTAAVVGDPALVVALSPNQNTIANALYVRPRQMSTYGAGYRLAVATAGVTYLGLTFAVNTDKQLATIYHAASATKTVRIKRITVWLHLAAAGTFQFEARRLSATTAPATGNPAITPGAYDSSDGAAEATCLALPTTQGSEAIANSPLTPNYTWNAASSTAETSGAIAAHELLLFDARGGMPSGKELTLRAGVAEGIGIIGRSLTAVALNFTAYIEFTEE